MLQVDTNVTRDDTKDTNVTSNLNFFYSEGVSQTLTSVHYEQPPVRGHQLCYHEKCVFSLTKKHKVAELNRKCRYRLKQSEADLRHIPVLFLTFQRWEIFE